MVNPIRFLFLLYYYPPVPGTAARRNDFISKALAAQSIHSVLLTATREPLKKSSITNLDIRTIPAMDYRAWLRRQTSDGALPESKKKSRLMQWMIRLINSFPFNIIAGEGGIIYFFNMLIQGQRAIRQENITHLYSSYRPFADHFVAGWLKRRNPHLYWIADFRDLIIDPHYQHIFFPNAHHRFFKKLFSQADVLTTVSEGLATSLRAYHSNVVTLRNGIDGEIVIPAPQPEPHFTIVYTGSMFLDKRNAKPLFHALQTLMTEHKIVKEDIHIIYAGKDGADWKALAAEFDMMAQLDDKGIVSGDEASRLQESACINLLLTISSNQLQGVLTGKMIEYFQSGSPVLGIVVGQNDPELSAILEELEIGSSFSDQHEELPGIKNFIHTEYQLWKLSGANRKPVNVGILNKKYGVDEVMKSLPLSR